MNDTKQDLLDYLKKLNFEVEFSNIEDFSTISIADGFHISRSLASQYLNSLYREGKVIKIDSRPVYYIHRSSFERDFDLSVNNLSFGSLSELKDYLSRQKKTKYSFKNIVGYDGSLSETISQIKSAISYPVASGLNYILYGENGSGKSLLSKCAYEYLLLNTKEEKKRIICDGTSRNFIRDFCNAVVKAKEGIVVIKKADFISDDNKNVLARILENKFFIDDEGKKHFISCSLVMLYDSLNIENLNSLIDFFPIKCLVPNFKGRYSSEKEGIIINFFKVESKVLSKDIYISYALMKYLLNTNYRHNLDDLKNIIKEICARANIKSESKLYIGVNYLPERIVNTGNALNRKEINACQEWINVNDYVKTDVSEGILNLLENILLSFDREEYSFKTTLKNCSEMLNKFFDENIFNDMPKNDLFLSNNMKFEDVINETLYTYNHIVPEHCGAIISYYMFIKNNVDKKVKDWELNHQKELKKANDILLNSNSEINVIIERIKIAFSYNLNVALDDVCTLILEILFLNYNSFSNKKQFDSIIICHGVSTAYSIANTVNSFVCQHIFEYVDMPLDKSMEDVAKYVSRYIKRFSIKNDILILVDMGALEELGKYLDDVENNIYVLNNVSTPMALSVASKIIQNESIEEIRTSCKKDFCSNFSSYENCTKKDAIVFLSDNGKNMATRLKDTFIDSLPKHIDVQIFTYNRIEAEMGDYIEKIKKEYNILFILGASNIDDDQNYISVESLVKESEINRITDVLGSYLNREEILQFRENLIYNFSLQSIIDNLSVLDADKVLFYTRNAVDLLQKEMNYKFLSDVLPGIYIHICFMVERLVTKEPISCIGSNEDFERENKVFVNIAKKSFSTLCSNYGVELTTAEIKYLYDYIEYDRRKKENE